ncbi:P-II family nitrogen regulator [Dehalobacterium formicoaceticum]|uniref:P-II family nitrogen regulator n=1 Tax=Dehalobacterium formicoaceticum TaxID=51515 RepID=UPI003083F21B
MMINSWDHKEIELIYVIVNFGIGSKVVKIAKKNGITGGTILLGKGTIKNRLLEFLDLNDTRKEIVMMIAEKSVSAQALEKLNQEFHFNKPNHGIAFTLTVDAILGSKKCNISDNMNENKGGADTMYKAIFVVVDKGNAEDVIEAAQKAGSRGGTIMNARGSGIHETHTLFAMPIEPEKEIVLILAENKLTEEIVTSIKEIIHIDEPGKGIIFILDVNKTYGLY